MSAARPLALLRDPKIDLRYRALFWLLALAIPLHVSEWLRAIFDSGRHLYECADSWSSLILLPEPWELIFGHLWLWLAAAILILRRGGRASIYCFIASVFAQTLLYPFSTSNHWTLICFALAICLVFPLPASGGNSKRSAIGPLRILCAMTYWFAFLHKLNHRYLDAGTSAVKPFAQIVLSNLSNIDGAAFWTGYGAIFVYASLAIELSLPLLLFYQRTRIIGCALGLVFHGAIVLTGHGDYSQTILSFYVLFFEENELAALIEKLRAFSIPRALISLAIALTAIRFSFLASLVAKIGYSPPRLQFAIASEWILCTALIASCSYLLLTLLRSAPIAVTPVSPMAAQLLPRTAAALLLLAYAFNCLGPYFGFQFNHAQAMFNSLDVHASNHLFLPRLKLFENDEYVEDLRVDWIRPPDAKLLGAHPDLKAVLNHRGQILGNELRSLMAHACASEWKPRLLTMRVANGQAEVHFDPCNPLVHYNRFNAYDWVERRR